MAKTVLLTESLSFIINLDGIYLLGYAWLFGMCKFGSILVETTVERLLSSVDYILWRLVAHSASPISSLTGRRRCDRLSDSSYVSFSAILCADIDGTYQLANSSVPSSTKRSPSTLSNQSSFLPDFLQFGH